MFVAYSGDYGETVARFVDECLWQHKFRPRIALPDTHGEIPIDDEEIILQEESQCKIVLALITERAVESPEFKKEVRMAHRPFRIPVIVLRQGKSRSMLIVQEDPRIKFSKGRHASMCPEILRWIRKILARSDQSEAVPLTGHLQRRTRT